MTRHQNGPTQAHSCERAEKYAEEISEPVWPNVLNAAMEWGGGHEYDSRADFDAKNAKLLRTVGEPMQHPAKGENKHIRKVDELKEVQQYVDNTQVGFCSYAETAPVYVDLVGVPMSDGIVPVLVMVDEIAAPSLFFHAVHHVISDRCNSDNGTPVTDGGRVEHCIRCEDKPTPTNPTLQGKLCTRCENAEDDEPEADLPLVGAVEIERGVYPEDLTDERRWMAHSGKHPRAPWVNDDADRPCAKDGHTTTAECDCSAKNKWKTDESYRNLEDALMGVEYNDYVDEVCYIQSGEDNYLFFDGDNVRDPEQGFHPAFVALITLCGDSYTDISTSATGSHRVYQGELPADRSQAVIELDDEAWGSNDELPKLEIFSGKKVNVMTGRHVAGTPTTVEDVDEDALEAILRANDLPTEDPDERGPSGTEFSDFEPSEYEPDTTTSSETAGDIRDCYAALDRLDNQRVAEATIVHQWNDGVSTSDGARAFYPTWGKNSNGRANIVTDTGWDDTGGGGYGGPAVMAALDLGIMRPRSADPRRLTGEDWVKAYKHLRDLGFDLPELPGTREADSSDCPWSDGKEDGERVSALPVGLIRQSTDEAAARYVDDGRMKQVAVDRIREKLSNTVESLIGSGSTAAVRSPTGSGKTHKVATTKWSEMPDVTGEQPVVLLEPTRKARDDAADMAEEHGVDYTRLLGRSEACPCARGDHDHDDDRSSESFRIEGMDPSEWFNMMCENRGLPFSLVHSMADDITLGGLPCSREGLTCPAHGQWNGVPRDDDGNPSHDVIIATHQFAHVPGLRNHANIVIDEEPDYTADVDSERMKKAVNAYLQWLDAPINTFEDLIGGSVTAAMEDGEVAEKARKKGLAKGEYIDSLRDDMEEALGLAWDPEEEDEEEDEERDDTLDEFADLPAEADEETDEDAFQSEPPMSWYFENPYAHAMAPAIARAAWKAEQSGNGRYVGTEWHEPPRFDSNNGDDSGYNAVRVNMVVDSEYNIRRIRQRPNFGTARSVVGLDAHVRKSDPNWTVNVSPGLQFERILSPEEEATYRRFVRGLEVVQVGEATNPVTSRHYWDEQGDIKGKVELVVKRLCEEYGADFHSVISSKAVVSDIEEMVEEHGDSLPQSMHYGNTKSRNDFAGENVGLVTGAIDPGDGPVLDMVAEMGLHAEPESGDADCSACGGSPGGCAECEWTGKERAAGRGFTGPDAEKADAVLNSVRRNEVAQAVGRWARDAEDEDDNATVYVMTDVLPEEMVDLTAPGVTWTYTDNQKQVVEALRDAEEGITAPKLADELDLSPQAVHDCAKKLREQGLVTAEKGAGAHGATVYSQSADIDADGQATVTSVQATLSSSAYESTHTPSLMIHLRTGTHLTSHGDGEPNEGGDGPPPTASLGAPPG